MNWVQLLGGDIGGEPMGKSGEKWGISQSVFPIPHKINSPFFPIFFHFLWHFCEKFAIAVELKFNCACGKAFERQCPRETLPICCHMENKKFSGKQEIFYFAQSQKIIQIIIKSSIT